jgi:hypothetical protein
MKKTFILILIIISLAPAVSFGDKCVEGDCANGKGTIAYSTGPKYTGEFKDGERHGQGTLVYADGKTVEGEFKNGDFVGK